MYFSFQPGGKCAQQLCSREPTVLRKSVVLEANGRG